MARGSIPPGSSKTKILPGSPIFLQGKNMEPITFAFIFILGLASADQNNKHEEQIKNLTEWNYRLSAQLSSISGREKMNDDFQQRQIDAIKKYLEPAPKAE